jgi:hypothetical protein
VIAIASDDPLADKLHDIADVEKHCPGVVSGIREWFRYIFYVTFTYTTAIALYTAAIITSSAYRALMHVTAAMCCTMFGCVDSFKQLSENALWY